MSAHKITFEDFLATEQKMKICQAVQLIQQLAWMEIDLEALRAGRPIWGLIEEEMGNEAYTKRLHNN